jgi:hypothetical protein
MRRYTLSATVIAVVAIIFSDVMATPQEQPPITDTDFAGLSRADFEVLATAAMPIPILRLMRWKSLGRAHYAIELSLSQFQNAPQPAMNITFSTWQDADEATLKEALALAGKEARASMRRFGITQ